MVAVKQRRNNGANGGGRQLGGCTGRGFVPGRSGNPRGRPPRSGRFTDLLHERLAEPIDESGKTRLHQLAETLVQRAIAGDWHAVKFVLDRIDPVPTRPQADAPAGGIVIEMVEADPPAVGEGA